MQYVVLIGRILYSAIFVLSGFTHFFPKTIEYAVSFGVPIPYVLVPISGIIAIVGGLSVLLAYLARYGAWLIVLFLVIVTLMLHRFWEVSNPSDAQAQMIFFMKNLSMLGGALLITYFGSGPLSIKDTLASQKK